MPEKLADLFVDINIRLDKMEKDLNRAEKKTKQTGKKMESSFKGVGTAVKGMLAPLLALASFSVLTRLTKEALEFGQAIRDQAKNLGLTTDELQFFQFTAQNAGIPVRQMEIAVQRLGRRLGEARQGIGEARKAFNELGILEDVDSGNLESVGEVVEEVLRKTLKMNDATERNALLMKLVDSEGVPAFNGMATAIEGAREAVSDFNTIIDEGTLAALENVNVNVNLFFAELSAGFKRVIGTFAKGLIALQDVDKTTAQVTEEGVFARLLVRQESLLEDLAEAEQRIKAAEENEAAAAAQRLGEFFGQEPALEKAERVREELKLLDVALEKIREQSKVTFEGVNAEAAKLEIATGQIEKLRASLRLDEAFISGGTQGEFLESVKQQEAQIRKLGTQAQLTEDQIQDLVDRMTEVEEFKFEEKELKLELKEASESLETFAEVADDNFDSIGDGFGDMVGDMVFDAEKGFNEILAAFGRMIAQMTFNRFISFGVDSLLSSFSLLGGAPVPAGAGGPAGGAVINILQAPGTTASVAPSFGTENAVEVMIENTIVRSITGRGAAGQAIESTFNLGNPGTPGGRL